MVDLILMARLDAAVVLQDRGNYAGALNEYSQLLPLLTDDADACFFIGCRLLEMKRNDEAIAALNQAIEARPDHVAAYNNLGVAWMAKEDTRTGASAFQKALEIEPGNADAKRNLSAVYAHMAQHYEQSGSLELAATHYELALELLPNDFRTTSAAGAAYVNLGNEERAGELLRRAVTIQPADRVARRSLVDMYEKASRLDMAMSAIERARLEIGADAAFDLVEAKVLRRRNDLQGALGVLEGARLDKATLTTRTNSLMEKGQILDRLDRVDDAMEAFREGNAAAAERLETARYTAQQFVDQVGSIQSFLENGDFSDWPNNSAEAPGPTPVFMVGFPRSGTTLLDNMLDAHPQCEVLEERETIVAVHATMIGLDREYPDLLTQLREEEAESYRQQYWDTVGQIVSLKPGQLVIDKLPLNIIRVPLIRRILPNAKFIFSLRHPCDCVLSCYMQSFGMNAAMANFLTLEDTASLYADVMNLWQRCVDDLSLDVHSIKYEDLTADFETETRAVLDFLGLPWSDAILGYRERIQEKGLVTTPSYHQITEPIYSRATARWERYREYLEPQMAGLAPFIKTLGYTA